MRKEKTSHYSLVRAPVHKSCSSCFLAASSQAYLRLRVPMLINSYKIRTQNKVSE